MDQVNIFDNDQPCVRCPTVFCRLFPCTEAQGVKCCAACDHFKNCKTAKCEHLTKAVQ